MSDKARLELKSREISRLRGLIERHNQAMVDECLQFTLPCDGVPGRPCINCPRRHAIDMTPDSHER